MTTLHSSCAMRRNWCVHHLMHTTGLSRTLFVSAMPTRKYVSVVVTAPSTQDAMWLMDNGKNVMWINWNCWVLWARPRRLTRASFVAISTKLLEENFFQPKIFFFFRLHFLWCARLSFPCHAKREQSRFQMNTSAKKKRKQTNKIHKSFSIHSLRLLVIQLAWLGVVVVY